MTALASAISSALIHFLWQGSVVGLSLCIVLFALKKRSANSRYMASCAALAMLVLLPVITTWALYRGSVSPDRPPAPSALSHSRAANEGAVAGGQSPWLKGVQSWALTVWSIGVGIFSLRLVLGYQHAFRMRRRGKPAGEGALAVVHRLQKLMGVHRRIRVLVSSMADSPSVVGWLRPVILLPAATLMGLTPLQLEAILAHEIGHIRRYDYLVNMLQMLVETLLFYHPAVWWTSKRIRLERELCCDDLAVQFSGNALRYARALTTLEKLRLRTPGVVMASTGGPLLYRIQRLVGVSGKEYGSSRLASALAIGLGIMCFSLNVTGTQGQEMPGVQVDLGSSSVIHRTPVRYPEAAQKQGITGSVQIEVKLDSTGNVADARVLTGPEELRKAALESVLNWHFTSDAARSTRLITISFATQGTQVQVRELAAVRELVSVNETEWRKIEEAKADIAKAQAVASVRWESALAQSAQYEAARAQERLKALGVPVRGSFVVGRALKGISTPGLPDSVSNDLISRLPIRVGDVFSLESWQQTDRAIHGYDEHLRVQFIRTDDGQVELRISAPNQR